MRNVVAFRISALTWVVLLVLAGILVMALGVQRDATCAAFSPAPQQVCRQQPLQGHAVRIGD